VKCECSCVLPTAAVGRWLVLLLSRLLSGHRWPDAAPASDAGIGHYQALVSEFRSTAWRPPLDGLRPGSYHGFHDLPCFRVRREPAQDEGEAGGDHGVAVAVAEDAAAAGQDVFVQLLGRLVLAQLGQRAGDGESGAQGVGVVLAQHAAAAGQGIFAQLPGRLVLIADRKQAEGQVVGLGQGVGVILAQDTAAAGQGIFL